MTLTTHAVIGAVVGAATGDPVAAFGIGFVSHFLVDIIPHGDRHLYDAHKDKTAHKKAYTFVTIDAIAAIIIVALMVHFSTQSFSAAVALGIIGSVLPDLIIGIHEAWNKPWLNWFHKLHFSFHNLISDKTGDVPLRFGLIGQLIFIIAVQQFF